MALLLIEGFDHLLEGSGNNSGILYKWATASSAYIDSDFARTGLCGVDVYGTLISKPLPAVGGFVFGAGVFAWEYWGVEFTSTVGYFQAREGTTVHLSLTGVGDGRLCVKCGATVLATGTKFLVQDTWYYIEFKGLISNAGYFEVRIDGVLEMSGVGNTRNGGLTGQWDRLCLAGEDHGFDDVYVCDFSGLTQKDFLGVSHVETLRPVLDAVGVGSHRDFQPSGGTDHGAMVDDPNANTTDYTSSAVPGAKETYRLSAPVNTTGLEPQGVQTNLFVAKAAVGVSTVCAIVRVGGVDYEGPVLNPTVAGTSGIIGWQFFSLFQPNSPAGSPWAAAQIATLEAGMKIVS